MIRHKIGKIVLWVFILAGCVGVATGLALWWNVRADARFQAHLQSASLEELQRLAKERDWDPEVYYFLGTKLTESGRHREAVNALARSAALNPHSTAARAALGLALARTDHPAEAEAVLRQAIALDPRQAWPHFALGNLYGRYERWAKAADEFEAVLKLKPDDPETAYLLGQCYGELFQEDKKMDLLERAVKRDPNNPRYLKSLGNVYIFFGRFKQAEEAFRRVAQLTPDDQENRYMLGRALAEQANSPEAFAVAEQELTSVVAKVPKNPSVHLALGILYFRRNDAAKAIKELELAQKLGITEHKAWLYLGQAYMRVGRTKEGKKTLAEFQRGATIARNVSQLENRLLNAPDDTEARLRLIRTYIDDHDYQRALNHLRVIQEKDRNNPQALKLTQECQAHMQTEARRTQ
ncbi:MAG TPA: tetratricopeptide repeat protein [Chthonomonadaceae bacterium]|nr:tetratricopeptide repeat protein [Chthonomonadaceae bacterium]